jgi:hypothetical protein
VQRPAGKNRGMMSSARSVPKCYTQDISRNELVIPLTLGSLSVASYDSLSYGGGDLTHLYTGCNSATLFLGEINTGTWSSRLGVSENRDRKIWLSHVELRRQRDCSG